MKLTKIVFGTLLQLLSLLIVAYVGSSLGFVLSLAGFVTIKDIPRWSFAINYIYFPFSAFLFACSLISLLVGGENHRNQLVLRGNEFGFKLLKFWKIQNLVVASICFCCLVLATVYSMGLYRGIFEQSK